MAVNFLTEVSSGITVWCGLSTDTKPTGTVNDIFYETDTGTIFTHDGSAWQPPITNGVIGFIIDGGGSEISTGLRGFLEVPYDCTINAARLFADQSGSIVVDIWVDTYANFPPTDADSITASAPPTLTSAQNSEDTTLTGWSRNLTAGQIIGYNVDSVTTVTRVLVSLTVERR